MSFAQTSTFNIAWNSGPAVEEEGINSVFEVDDGYLVFGYGGFSDSTSQALRVVKFDHQGQFLWQKQHRRAGSLFGGFVSPVARINDSSYVVALTEYAPNVPTSSYLYWFNAEGDTTETRFLRSDSLYGPVQQFTLQTMVVSDGDLIISGKCPQPPNAACLTRTTSSGELIWEKSYLGVGAIDQATFMQDGGFILGGSRNTNIDKSVVIRTDSAGDPIWTRYHGGYAIMNALHSLITNDDHLLFPGSWKVDPTWNDYVWWSSLYKYTSDGELLDRKDYDFSYEARELFVVPVSMGGGYWMIGSKVNQEPPYEDIMSLSRLDQDLERSYMYTYSRFDSIYSDNQITCYRPTEDGGIILGGLTRQGIGDPAPHLCGFWLLKLDEYGCLVPGCQSVGVQDMVLGLEKYLHVWPNPLAEGGHLAISFQPPLEFKPNGALRLVVQDALGRKVHEEHIRNSFALSIELNTVFAHGLYHIHLVDDTRWLAGSKVVVE